MLNLSSYPLKTHEINLLAKGLKFIPKPLKPNEEAVGEAFTEFAKRIKLAEYWQKFSKHQNDDKEPKPFYPKSGWAPNWPSRDTWKELVELEKEIQKVNLYQSKSNLTKEELEL